MQSKIFYGKIKQKKNNRHIKGEMMKSTQKYIALALGAAMTLPLLAGCGGGEDPYVQNDPYVKSRLNARICYDNLPDDGIELAETDVKYTLELKKNVDDIVVSAVDEAGNPVSDMSRIASYDEASKTLTATKGGIGGTVKLSLQKGDKEVAAVRVEVEPAYVTNPNNQFTGNHDSDMTQTGSSRLAGGCHDPSLIEVQEDGQSAYYIFSTGWAQGNEIRRSADMIHWDYKGKATSAKVYIPEIEDWINEKNSATSVSGQGSIQWWAPDIVPAYDGGYWLYTCNVSNTLHDYQSKDPVLTPSGKYSRACITLFYSDTLDAESFEYVGVLMQSFIPDGTNGAIDVNSIDPQIVYDTDGKMYMAYGSFGTGNWMLELDPKTGLRKDGLYKDGIFLTEEEVREKRNEAVGLYKDFNKDGGQEIKTDYYGKMISMGAMEAPVFARHDNVTVSDENGVIKDEKGKEITGKTFYYTTHSFNPLEDGYAIWGGRSESVWGLYRSVNGGVLYCEGKQSSANTGNKYMGSFTWENKTPSASKSIDIIFPGHNDLFTRTDGTSVAAYITRTRSYNTDRPAFMTQIHQYYLNSFGDICINPNRYGGEVSRVVTKEELLKYTDGGKFKMVSFAKNIVDPIKSVDVVLTEDGKINYQGAQIGSWLMYGAGYIKLQFNDISKVQMLQFSGETVYYGVVRPAWLDDQNRSGFTITTLGHDAEKSSMALFMNNYSTITGDRLVG